jgi:hypothetical protein
VLWLTIAILLGVAQSAAPPGTQPSTRPAPVRPDARMTMCLPATITLRDIDRYAAILELSPAQRGVLELIHQRYLETVTTLVRERMQGLDAANAFACTVLDSGGLSNAFVTAINSFYDEQDDVEKLIDVAERTMFDELQTFLAEAQGDALIRVLNHRQRQRCTSMAYRIKRASWVDLSSYVEDAVTDDEVLDRLDPLLREYETALTPLTTGLEREMRMQDRSLLELLVWMQRDDSDQPLPLEARVKREQVGLGKQMAILAPGVRLQDSIVQLNTQTLPQLLEQLPPDRARIIHDRYVHTVYPQIYPDHYEFGAHICALAAESNELNDAQRTAVTQVCTSYTSSYAALCAEMERACDQWRDFYATTRFSMDRYEPYQARMRKLRQQRLELGQNLLKQVRSLAPAETPPELHMIVADRLARIGLALTESQDPNDNYPGF